MPSDGSSDQVLNALTGTSPSDLYAVGRHLTASSTYSARAVRNSGSGWADLALPALSGTSELTDATSAGPGNAWFGGYASDPTRVFVPALLHAVGATATRVSLPAPPAGTSELESDIGLPLDSSGGSDLWVAATYLSTGTSGGTEAVLYRPRSGGGWTSTLLATPFVDAVDAVSTTTGYLGGAGLFRDVNGTVTRVGLPGSPPYVRSITSRSASDVWVLAADSSGTPSLFHFDGTSWTPVPIADPGTTDGLTAGTIRVAPNGVLWLLGNVVADGYADASWTGRYDPATATWASVVSTVGAGNPETGFGNLDGLLALSGGDVYAAGWGLGQRPGFVGRLCQLTAATSALTPSSVRVGRLGDGVIVTAGSAVTTPVTVTDGTGAVSSGPLAAQQGAALRPYAAGTYRVTERPGGFTSSVSVPVRIVDHTPGPQAVSVFVATRPAPSGYRYVLQVRLPGATSWQNAPLDQRTGGIAGVFNHNLSPATWPAGTYAARARLQNVGTGTSTNWSPTAQFVLPPP